MFLMITSVIFLLVQLVQFNDPVGLDLVELLDMCICIILLVDFVYDLYKTPDKLFFLKHRWWEPLSSIPLIDTGHKAVLAIRLLRIIRIMRIIKLHKDIRIYLRKGNAFLVKNKVLDISSIVLMTILGGSLGFFYAEQGVNPNLKTYSDSIWWALVTVTTIGYGDIFPVTTMGRFVATTMMIIGIGCVSTLTGMKSVEADLPSSPMSPTESIRAVQSSGGHPDAATACLATSPSRFDLRPMRIVLAAALPSIGPKVRVAPVMTARARGAAKVESRCGPADSVRNNPARISPSARRLRTARNRGEERQISFCFQIYCSGEGGKRVCAPVHQLRS